MSESNVKLPHEEEGGSDFLTDVMASVEQNIKNASAAVIAEVECSTGESVVVDAKNNNVFDEPCKNSSLCETAEEKSIPIPSFVVSDVNGESSEEIIIESSKIEQVEEEKPKVIEIDPVEKLLPKNIEILKKQQVSLIWKKYFSFE